MKRLLTLLLLSLTFCCCSCSGQDIDIKLTIYNKSGKVLDSLLIHDVFEKETMYYNIPADTTIIKIYHDKKSLIPKGERGVLSLVVFDKDVYYWQSNGFINFPGAMLEDAYEFYIYDGYITTEKDFKPVKLPEKYKISEMPKESIEKVKKDR